MGDHVVIRDTLYSDGMMRIGWIVVTGLSHGDTYYGVFASKDEAVEYGKKLINAVVYPIFFPSQH